MTRSSYLLHWADKINETKPEGTGPSLVKALQDAARDVASLEVAREAWTFAEYQHNRTAALGASYHPDRKPNHALGLAGEALEMVDEWRLLRSVGRIAEAVKKEVYHGKQPDRAKLLDELGDVLWHVMAIAVDYGSSLEEVAHINDGKLRKRYPGGFVKGGGIRETTVVSDCPNDPPDVGPDVPGGGAK